MKIRRTFSVRIGRPASGAISTPQPRTPVDDGHPLFRPVAARYQRQLVRFVLCAIAGFCLTGLSLLLPEFLLKWVAIPGVALIALSLVLFFTLPALPCPSCGRSTDGGFDKFCPACGEAQLRTSAWRGTQCGACGRTMGSYKYRNYPVRYCTHCGILLDRRGV